MLVYWMDLDKWACAEPLQVFEIFSGKARVSRMASWMGLVTRAMDIQYDKPRSKISRHSGEKQRSSMDVCGEAGFVFSGCAYSSFFLPQTSCPAQSLSMMGFWISQPLQIILFPPKALYLVGATGSLGGAADSPGTGLLHMERGEPRYITAFGASSMGRFCPYWSSPSKQDDKQANQLTQKEGTNGDHYLEADRSLYLIMLMIWKGFFSL